MKRFVFFLLAIFLFSSIRSEFFQKPIESCPASDLVIVHKQQHSEPAISITGHVENYQHIINYFAPYVGVLILRFTETLVHELGHALSYRAITKEWATITIGNDDAEDNLLFSAEKFKLFLPNPETLHFGGSADPCGVKNKYFDTFITLMGPVSGALFAISMLQFIQHPALRYALRVELFDDIFQNLLTKSDNADGFLALQTLQLPTQWMEDFEHHEYVLADSVFDLVNLPQIVDLLMFCKLLQAGHEQQRLIMLGGQLFFRVMIPYFLSMLQQTVQTCIDFVHAQIDIAETLTVQTSDNNLMAIWWQFSRLWLMVVMPILFMHEIIKLNAQKSIVDYTTNCF